MKKVFCVFILLILTLLVSNAIVMAQQSVYELPTKKEDVEKIISEIKKPLVEVQNKINLLQQKIQSPKKVIKNDPAEAELVQANQKLAKINHKLEAAELSNEDFRSSLRSMDSFRANSFDRQELIKKAQQKLNELSELRKEKQEILAQKQNIENLLMMTKEAYVDTSGLQKELAEAQSQKAIIEKDVELGVQRSSIWGKIIDRVQVSQSIITDAEISDNLKALANIESKPKTSILGASTETYFITAISSIIADQFKADLIELFLGRFKNNLNKNELAKTFFPITLSVFKPEDIFYYEELGTSWKESFKKDLQLFPNHLFEYLQIKKPNSKYNEYIEYAGVAYKIIEVLKDNGSIFIKIKKLADDVNDTALIKTNGLQPTLKLIVWLQEKFLTFESKGIFKDIMDDNIKLKIFLNELFTNNREFIKFIKLESEESIIKQMTVICKRINAIYKCIGDIKKIVDKDRNEEITKEDANKIFNCSKELITNALSIGLKEKQKETLAPEGSSSEDVKSISAKNAIIKTYNSEIERIENIILLVENVYGLYQSIYEQNYFQSIKRGIALLKKLEIIPKGSPTFKSLETILNYSNFIEGIAAAQNPDDMKSLLSKVILPRYSAFLKRRTEFTLTISAHPGIFGGREWLNSVEDNGGITPNSFGFTVPVGLEFCWGGPKKWHTSGALLISIIDPAAVVSYLIKKTSPNEYSGLPQKMTFQQIFAPGAFIYYGLKDLPICLFAGVQYMPELRKIVEGDVVTNQTHSYRAIAGISWDIALVGIYPRLR